MKQTCFLKNGPLISVVVPVYNMEKYLERCIDSILEQTYENLEIILVDDCSTDGSAKIIEKYIEQDERIKRVVHKTNRGLFQARISGYDVAEGKYIAFVDSDDYLSIDWFRVLVKKAEIEQADITVGEWCFDFSGQKRYCNMDHFRIKDYLLTGDDVLEKFMEQGGRNFSWSIVVNKLYNKKLWDQCICDLKQFSNKHGHMIMWEDVTFSSCLWTHAQKVVNVHGVNYYYVKHESASTSPQRNKKRNLKYISDASSALHFMKEQLESAKRYGALEEHYLNWKQHFVSIFYQDIVKDLGMKNLEDTMRESFEYDGEFSERNNFFYELQTPLAPTFQWFDDIKKRIIAPETRYVSFDIFDTLIQRPFWNPTDLFAILSNELNEGCSSYVDFTQIRIDAEKRCRKRLEFQSPSCEEITLDEIYDFISENYAFDESTILGLKEREKELEICYAQERRAGKELYELAQEAGKNVILCSDMYLPKETIETLLKKNGYTVYQKLYLSSDLKLTKSAKSLYRFVKKALGVNSEHTIVHIGDNWVSDVENAETSKIGRGQHLAKATETFTNRNPGIYAGEVYQQIFMSNDRKEDYRLMLPAYVGLRSALALVANRFFDNPYVSIFPQSDFNADPNYIGYFAFGTHLLALAHWIKKIAKQRKIPTVHFVARDGYMVKQAFDIINQTDTTSNYIRVSRRSLLLADVNSVEDLYSLSGKMDVLHCSPKKLQEYLEPIIAKEKKRNIEKVMSESGFIFDREFKEKFEYQRCLKVFIDELVDLSLLASYKEKLREYFAEMIKPGDYLFDVGYNGRPEAALSNLLGYPIGSFYVHANSEIAELRQRKYGFLSECFYSYKPCITGLMREHLMMELGPSTIGYKENNGKMEPVFEEYHSNYESDFVTTIIQEKALEFVKNYHDMFQDQFVLPLDALSAPFEYYLHYSKPFDRQIFSTLPFEDKLGEGKVLNALEFWNQSIFEQGLTSGCANIPYALPPEMSDLYFDGLFVKFYKIINKCFPKGGRMREFVKKCAALFIK